MRRQILALLLAPLSVCVIAAQARDTVEALKPGEMVCAVYRIATETRGPRRDGK